MLEEILQKSLDARASQNSLRKLKVSEGMVDFCSNDYLGFAKKSWNSSGAIGSTGSRLISGNHAIHEEFEAWLAEFHGAQAALVFNSGYDANLGLFSTVPKKGDTVVYDQLCHASIRDGLRLGTARNFSFKHNDIEDLKQKLDSASGNVFVAVESIYSMDGDKAPLKEIAELCQQSGAYLIVDEAHSTGIYGEKGEGLCSELGVKPFVKVHTFGKAMGSHGAAIVGPAVLRQYLVNFSRSFIYTTALPPQSIAKVFEAYKKLKSCEERSALKSNIQLFKENCTSQNLIKSDSPIQCVIIGGNDRCKSISEELQKAGLDVRPILHPTVAEGSERIRICLHSYNSKEEIIQLCKLLNTML